MGKATRWLKGILGMKQDKEKERDNFDTLSSVSSEKREKKRWSFGKSGRNTDVISRVNISGNAPVKDAGWIGSYLAETDIEQNKHAIVVAAAAVAAADAAVAAAQATVGVLRLTSQGRRTMFVGGRQRWAAAKIQAVFRGYLARKALRALKGLVKLQALVRGYLVRKRAAATLHSMHALIRAQTNIRSQRALRSMNKENKYPKIRARRSIEKCDDARNEVQSKRLSHELSAFDESPKIVKMDTYKPLSSSRRITIAALSECEEDFRYQAISSPLPYPIPARISIPECNNNYSDFDWYVTGEKCKFATAQSTPRFANSIRSNVPVTPVRSVCGDCYYRPYSNFSNYMANTQSFKAKLRSHSASKQRLEPVQTKKIFSLNEIMASRNSISSIKMQRQSSQLS